MGGLSSTGSLNYTYLASRIKAVCGAVIAVPGGFDSLAPPPYFSRSQAKERRGHYISPHHRLGSRGTAAAPAPVGNSHEVTKLRLSFAILAQVRFVLMDAWRPAPDRRIIVSQLRHNWRDHESRRC